MYFQGESTKALGQAQRLNVFCEAKRPSRSCEASGAIRPRLVGMTPPT